MAGTSKKRGKKMTPKKRAESKNPDNVTINDFANSPSGLHGRLKKAATLKAESCEVAYDTCEDSRKVEEDSKPKETKPRRKSKLKDSCEEDEYEGTYYPMDLWFLISEYIEPEAVGKFASICKSSYHVVKSAKFWFHLYKRYYRQDAKLPVRLRPDCMVRPYGLRACVIRALHFMYFSSLQHIAKNPYLQQEDPHSLVKRRCCLMWHKKGKIRWYFYFKLKEITNKRSVHREETDWDIVKKTDFAEMLENVSVNTEDGCRILQITCMKYGMVPLAMGLILQTVKVNLSPGFDHHRLQMGFGTSYIPKIPTQLIVLNDVIDIKVFDWWDPCYPHHDVVSSTILETTNESWDFVSSGSSDYLTV